MHLARACSSTLTSRAFRGVRGRAYWLIALAGGYDTWMAFSCIAWQGPNGLLDPREDKWGHGENWVRILAVFSTKMASYILNVRIYLMNDELLSSSLANRTITICADSHSQLSHSYPQIGLLRRHTSLHIVHLHPASPLARG